MRIKLLILEIFLSVSAQANLTQTNTNHNSSAVKILQKNKLNTQNPWALLQQTITKLNQVNYSTPLVVKQLIEQDILPLVASKINRYGIRILFARL